MVGKEQKTQKSYYMSFSLLFFLQKMYESGENAFIIKKYLLGPFQQNTE